MVFLKILLLTAILMGLAFAGFAIKMFFKKDGEFKKQCSSVNPKTGKAIGCVCGGEGEGSCQNKELVSKIKINVREIETKQLS